MIKAGITGGIGSGKTLVSGIFYHLGIPVFYADTEAARLIKTNKQLIDKICKIFSENIVDENGQINRKKLRELIFKNDTARIQVNKLVHPLVQENFEQWCHEQGNVPFVLKEAAILFESGANQGLDKVIVVAAPETLRIDRVVKRDRVNADEVKSIIEIQMSEAEKKARADFIIVNDEEQLLIPQVLKVYNSIKEFASASTDES